jgi:hypothetical protein
MDKSLAIRGDSLNRDMTQLHYAARSSLTQETPAILWNLTVHYSFHNSGSGAVDEYYLNHTILFLQDAL